MRIADEAQRRFGRKVSWGASCGDVTASFTTLSVPAMTRLRMSERRVLDTLIESGVARSRSHALAWCVRLVAERQEEWLKDLPGRTQEGRGSARRGADRLASPLGAQVPCSGGRRWKHGREGTLASPSPDIRRPIDPGYDPRAVVGSCFRTGDTTIVDQTARTAAARPRSRYTFPAPSELRIPSETWTDLGPDDKWAKVAIDHVAGIHDWMRDVAPDHDGNWSFKPDAFENAQALGSGDRSGVRAGCGARSVGDVPRHRPGRSVPTVGRDRGAARLD